LEIYLADFWIIEAADLDVALQHVAEESRAGEIAPLRGRGGHRRAHVPRKSNSY